MQNKSIWHTTKEKPMLQRDIILCGDGWSMAMDIIPETVNNICWKNVEKWCYLDDLIKENDHTRKALDKAKKGLEELKDIIACPPDVSYETGVSMYADGVLQEITALEQKDK